MTLPRNALLPAATGIVASLVVTRLVARYVLLPFGPPDWLAVIAVYAVLFGGFWWTASSLSHRFGTGHTTRDFRLSWRLRDLWTGLGVFLLGLLVRAVILTPFADKLTRLRAATSSPTRLSTAGFVAFAIAAIVGAPLFEELAFRGVLRNALLPHLGVGGAVFTQGIAFGVYHVVPGVGFENVPYTLALGAVGVVFGWIAQRTNRLGPSSTAHCVNNTIATLVMSSRR